MKRIRQLPILLLVSLLSRHAVVCFCFHSPSSILSPKHDRTGATTCTHMALTVDGGAFSSSEEQQPRPFLMLNADMTPEEMRAKALADYLERIQLEKQLAIAQIKVEKQQEIEDLQRQLVRAAQRVTPSASASAPMVQQNYFHPREQLLELSKQQLIDRVLFYQTYTQQYMWEAEQEKRRAVQQANDEAQKKWTDYMTALQLSPTQAGPSSIVTKTTSTSTQSSPLYVARQNRILQHSTDGNALQWTPLRWGSMEVQRLRGEARPFLVPAVAGPVRSAPPTVILTQPPPAVAEADHGLSSQGAVGGPTLAERVCFGPETGRVSWQLDQTSSTVNAAPAAVSPLYQQRNAKIVEQASNERAVSRWGSMEVQKLQGVASPVVPLATAALSATATVAVASPTSFGDSRIAEADHGLRADGGVGGPTLADRVNVGAQLLRTSEATTSTNNNLYNQRNAKIVAAADSAASGQNYVRWGDMEVQRLQGVKNPAVPRATAVEGAAVVPSQMGSTKTMPVVINGATDEKSLLIEKADHGLRADGGVGGPTLAERLTSAAGMASSAFATTTTTSSTINTLYVQRNAKVLQAGSASRWGDMEMKRLQGGSKPLMVENAVPSARGVVNIGATLVAGSTSKSSGVLPSTVVTMDGTMTSPALPASLTTASHAASGSMNAGSRSDSTMSTQELPFIKRNANLLRSAQAEQSSRWGVEEIERVRATTAAAALTPTLTNASRPPVKQDTNIPNLPSSIITLNEALSASAPAAPTKRVLPFTIASLSEVLSNAGNINVPPEVRAADHGLRADGGVGGLSLAERVASGAHASVAPNGSKAATSQPQSKAMSSQQQLEIRPYNQRNIKILEAAKAGQSRWGALEVERVQKTKPTFDVVSSGTVRSSAHVSLQERVNLGADLIRSTASQQQRQP